MEWISVLSSSGVAGLFTYILLDYLSLLDTERKEIKTSFLLMFSLVNVWVINTIDNIWYAILIIFILSTVAFPLLLFSFRKVMNFVRSKLNKNPIEQINLFETIQSAEHYTFVEVYDNGSIIDTGFLEKFQIDENGVLHIALDNSGELFNEYKENAVSIYNYHCTNSTVHYRIYNFTFSYFESLA